MAALGPKDLERILIEKLSQRYQITKSDMKRVFSQADSDKSGFLNLHELTEIFERFLVGVNRTQVQELIACYDINGDGYLSFDEFFHFLKNRNVTSTHSTRDSSMNLEPPTTIKEDPDDFSSEFNPDCSPELSSGVATFLQSLRSYFLHKAQKVRKKAAIENRLLTVNLGQEDLLQCFSHSTRALSVSVEDFCRFPLSDILVNIFRTLRSLDLPGIRNDQFDVYQSLVNLCADRAVSWPSDSLINLI
jgi:hypothetical protein